MDLSKKGLENDSKKGLYEEESDKADNLYVFIGNTIVIQK